MNTSNIQWILILLIVCLSSSIIIGAAQLEIVKNFEDCITSDVTYTNPDNTSEKYTVARITRVDLGKEWIEMKVQRDMKINFSWEKNGGKNTDLLFNVKTTTDKDFKEKLTCKGYENCLGENWIKLNYILKKGDVVRWGLWIRSSDLKNGSALVAINTKDIIPENINPSKPRLNISLANIIVGETLCVSATSDDLDDEQIKYSFNWTNRIDETRFIEGGLEMPACHSWSAPGSYEVRAKAMDARGKASDWSDALIVNVSEAPVNIIENVRRAPVLNLSTPMLIGPSAADVNDESIYIVSGIYDLDGIKYQIEWDGQVEELEFGDRFNHIWPTSGEKAIRVRAIRGQSMSNWSLPVKTDVYQKIEDQLSDTLPNIIKDSNNFTRFIFNENYQLDREIQILNKSHIILESNSNCMLSGQTGTHTMLDRVIMLGHSDNVIIRNLKCENAKTTIKLYNCSHCSIEGCTLNFGITCMYGIRLLSTNNISIKDNVLEYSGDGCDDGSRAVAMRINRSKDILISNNEININSDNLPVCYVIETESDDYQNITIRLPITNNMRLYSIKYNDCAAIWSYDDGITEATCDIPNNGYREEWAI